ncbi:HutD family protein [Fulvivirga ulvae]|uniref:HutD/Ves family protein n=1 Tax=Fulvivirga ulvae TaxID=2904245 RepID=UPI001F42E8D8|nr:HutD family protein [Fulvivirga ulvae]UII31433.1 HutD family protein [Fulvivirga ulvae]
MSIKILHRSQFTTTSWAGGTTTELMIYPEGSNYKALNFDFRLSIATVNVEKSVFTSLPGISRTLMVLDGNLELTHEGHHTSKLTKFKSDNFQGDWITTSFGRATDFNLMTTPGTQGTLKGVQLAPKACLRLKLQKNTIIVCYVLYGALQMEEKGAGSVEGGSLLWMEDLDSNNQMPIIRALTNTEVVIANINLTTQ